MMSSGRRMFTVKQCPSAVLWRILAHSSLVESCTWLWSWIADAVDGRSWPPQPQLTGSDVAAVGDAQAGLVSTS